MKSGCDQRFVRVTKATMWYHNNQCAAAARAGRKEEVASTDICVDVAKAAVIALTSLRRKKH